MNENDGRCDSMVRFWLLNSMSKELAGGFVYAQSNNELWSDICECFSLLNRPLLLQLLNEIVNLKQGGSSVSTYFN